MNDPVLITKHIRRELAKVKRQPRLPRVPHTALQIANAWAVWYYENCGNNSRLAARKIIEDAHAGVTANVT